MALVVAVIIWHFTVGVKANGSTLHSQLGEEEFALNYSVEAFQEKRELHEEFSHILLMGITDCSLLNDLMKCGFDPQDEDLDFCVELSLRETFVEVDAVASTFMSWWPSGANPEFVLFEAAELERLLRYIGVQYALGHLSPVDLDEIWRYYTQTLWAPDNEY